MLTRIHIKNFRSFSDVEIGPFKRINLIAGLNNSGKTGLLEAIFLVLAKDGLPGRPRVGKQAANLPNLFRVFSPQADANQDFWPWLFRDRNEKKDIEISVSTSGGLEEGVLLTTKDPNQLAMVRGGVLGPAGNLGIIHVLRPRQSTITLPVAVFSSHPSDPVQDAIDYNRVILKRGKRKVENLLKQVDDRIEAIEAVQTGQRPLIYADIGLAEMIPVTHLGEGFCRLLDIYSELVSGDAKVLLIDEVENGLHHTVMPIVWKGLIVAAKELDIQIFATTHSAECIFAADQAARNSKLNDLDLVRLDRIKDEIKATIVEQKDLETAREFNWELR
jgi:predicted ATP-dependent endonuclease of OLD family